MSPRDAFGRPQTVLLLGATSDIGLATVRRLVQRGARTVILGGRDPERVSDLEVDVDYRYFDATDTAAHTKFFNDLFSDHPRIDVVLVAFGVLHDQLGVEEDPSGAVEMAEVNYVGAASALLHVSQHMEMSGGGDLVLFSSVAGMRPRRSNYVYGSSKAGVDFMARGLATALIDSDVHVMVVRPGFVHTAMTRGMRSRPFAVEPQTVARAVVRGLARRDRVVYVPGVLRWVMAMVRLLPDRVVNRLEA